VGSGNDLTLNLALTFKPAFTGARNVYMDVYDGLDSFWQLKGAWTVTDSSPPSAVSVTPAAGSGRLVASRRLRCCLLGALRKSRILRILRT
jgi:hypothetical protein